MNCQHEGCNRTTVVDCIRPELIEAAEQATVLNKQIWDQLKQEYIEYFCPEHCQEYGYCWNCGFYQKELKEMDANGLCKFCKFKL